jgi:hypothetical protein
MLEYKIRRGKMISRVDITPFFAGRFITLSNIMTITEEDHPLNIKYC